MLVCLCKGVSDKTVRWLVQNGCGVKGVMTKCRAGTDCGTCISELKALVEETRSQMSADETDPVTAINE